jgi:hypothetical protein
MTITKLYELTGEMSNMKRLFVWYMVKGGFRKLSYFSCMGAIDKFSKNILKVDSPL